MVPRSTIRNPSRTRSWLVLPLATVLALVLSGTLLTTPAHAANPVTPGNFRGLGFDQCEAPSQSAMSTWIKKSPFRAAGIYISGASRACQRQSNLNATWVRSQLAAGWHLMPITLGPQASCSTRYPRYGRSIDPTINPSATDGYAAARAQGRLEARRAVQAARNLGLVPGSTLFYDLEAFNTRWSTSCTQSAIRFMHAWTRTLHTYHYASGYYSSAASGMRMMDDQRVKAGNTITMPDQIWIADWDGKANTASSHIRSSGWQPYGRMKQYRGGHTETWGGVRINIDRNYLDLRTPRLAGVAPGPATSGPRYTGASMSDPRCTTSTINRASYRNTGAGLRTDLIVPLQCMLKQKSLYPYEVTGRWNNQTVDALRGFQRQVGHRVRSYFTRGDWVSLLAAGNTGTVLKTGSRGTAVIRLQRALNAANALGIPIHGVYDTRTANAVGTYQRNVGIRATKVVASQTWSALVRGRW
jgi:hypothetical protein